MNSSLFVLITAWFLDLLFGDPERLPHPVVYMGKWISFGEHRLNKGSHRMLKGAFFALVSIALVFILSWAMLYFLRFAETSLLAKVAPSSLTTPSPSGEGWGEGLLSLTLIFFCLAGHTLRKEVRMVFEAVDRSLEDGRRQVARIVGRDTSQLDAQEIRTAALETLAENLSDGVIAPLFWFAILGVPGMLTYKMINTLDSMIGYHSERYKDFGCWAARIDDVANYIPARLTALLLLIANKLYQIYNLICHRNFHSSLFTLHSSLFTLRFGNKHASPNSGWPEAALAGILDCRFGGPHNYFGEYFYKPYIGTNPRSLTTADMQLSIRLCFLAECLSIAIVASLQYIN
ncbi:MAG: adenosylcobinamide-phosphate synthase CbiB [Prevotella sp.]|nr:adenosylcobinamide-phosphate synthase CbiB [Prevotella sp.]